MRVGEAINRHTCLLRLLPLVVALAVVSGHPAVRAQHRLPARHARARPPQFPAGEVSRVFFPDLFQHLVGVRPTASTTAAADSGEAPVASPTVAPPPGADSYAAWSRLISATTIEDEIKALKQNIDKTVTTPSSFAGRGHVVARLDFTLLGVLFAVVDQYDGEVRWKESAAMARDNFFRTAANLQAGGSIQVYNESKKRKQELDDLIRGTRLQGAANEDSAWDNLAERSALMTLLADRFETNLKQWVNSSAELRARREPLVREAELTAVIASVLLQEGMDDADDQEYRGFAAALRQASLDLVRAARDENPEAATAAVTAVSRSCIDCHDIYR